MTIANKNGKQILWVFCLLMLVGCDIEELRKPRAEKVRDTARGMVDTVYSHGTDLVIELEGDDGIYYLNRYLKNESADSFKSLLQHKEVMIQYYVSKSILNLSGLSRPIDTIRMNEVRLY
jgi:hypothetical protein